MPPLAAPRGRRAPPSRRPPAAQAAAPAPAAPAGPPPPSPTPPYVEAYKKRKKIPVWAMLALSILRCGRSCTSARSHPGRWSSAARSATAPRSSPAVLELPRQPTAEAAPATPAQRRRGALDLPAHRGPAHLVYTGSQAFALAGLPFYGDPQRRRPTSATTARSCRRRAPPSAARSPRRRSSPWCATSATTLGGADPESAEYADRVREVVQRGLGDLRRPGGRLDHVRQHHHHRGWYRRAADRHRAAAGDAEGLTRHRADRPDLAEPTRIAGLRGPRRRRRARRRRGRLLAGQARPRRHHRRAQVLPAREDVRRRADAAGRAPARRDGSQRARSPRSTGTTACAPPGWVASSS